MAARKSVTAVAEPRSERGRRMRTTQTLRPIDQIPIPPGGGNVEGTGAWAYYLRTDGATISDTLVIYPNGGVPELPDRRMADRYGANAIYYRTRQASKGIEYVGQKLTEQGVKRLVEILADNREDEILFCEDELAGAQNVGDTSDRPEVRDQARKRERQFEARLAYLRQPLDPEALISELNDIARAQQLASIDPALLSVMRAEVSERVAEGIARFRKTPSRSSGTEAGFDATGVDSIDS